MSQHGSLRSRSETKGHRNVLKRFERIETLKKEEKWKEGNSIYGLPKVKSQKVKTKKGKVAKPAAEGEGAETTATAAVEAPEAKKEKAKK